MTSLNYENIPAELKQLPQWVCWRYESRVKQDKPTKIPYSAQTQRKAISTDPETWAEYNQALSVYRKGDFNGIGFVFGENDPFVGIDLDGAVDAGKLHPWAENIVSSLTSYTELSPSGTGVHIIVKGNLPPGRRRYDRVEMYDRARYFTMTGNLLPNVPARIHERSEELARLHSQIFHTAPEMEEFPALSNLLLDDAALLEKARLAQNGNQFRMLYDYGDLHQYQGDESRADLALCNLLLFWTQGDCKRAEQLFSNSALGQREKWQQRQDYRERTLQAALAGRTDFYKKPSTELTEISHPHHSVNSVEGFLPNENPEILWEPVIPFPIHNIPAFPTEALPGWLRDFVTAEACGKETPPDLQAILALGAIATAVMGKACIVAGAGWKEPLNLYAVAILPSGERKSPSLSTAIQPLRDYEITLLKQQQESIATAEAERDILKHQYEQTRKEAALAKESHDSAVLVDKAKQLNIKLTGCEIPHPIQLLADDVTPETLPRLLMEQNGRLAILSDEAGLFTTFAGRYADGIANLDAICKAYDGSPIKVNRSSKDKLPVHVPNPLLTLVLTAQPGIMRGLIRHAALRDQGFLARFLFVFPQSSVGYRTNREPTTPQAILTIYRANLERLLHMEADRADDGKSCPHILSLGPEAQQVFLTFRDRAEFLLRPGELLNDVQDWGNKLPAKVARICGLLHLAEHITNEKPWTVSISAETMQRAVQIGDYLILHALAAFGEMGVDQTFDNARELLRWIQEKQHVTITVRDAQRAKPTKFKVVADANAALELLAERGYLRRWFGGKRGGPGQPASPSYVVHPQLLDAEKVRQNRQYYAAPITLTASADAIKNAEQVAEQRTSLHDNRRRAEEEHGEAGNASRDYAGALSERLIQDYLTTNGIAFQAAPDVAERTPGEPDLTLLPSGVTLDVKSSRPDYAGLAVNCRSLAKSTTAFFWPVLFSSETEAILCEPVSRADVVAWKVHKGTNGSDFYYCPRERLTPLVDAEPLQQLAGAVEDTILLPVEDQDAYIPELVRNKALVCVGPTTIASGSEDKGDRWEEAF